MSDQWFVHRNGEQVGPYTGDQMLESADQGIIVAETMVWAAGMPEWLPAGQVPGLLPDEPVVPVAAAAVKSGPQRNVPGARPGSGGAVAGARPVAGAAVAVARGSTTGGAVAVPRAGKGTGALAVKTHTDQTTADGEYPHVAVKKANFGLWVGMFAGGFICFLIGIAVMVGGSMKATAPLTENVKDDKNLSALERIPKKPDAAADAIAAEEMKAMQAEAVKGLMASGLAGGILLFIGWAIWMVSWVFFYINIYRGWLCLQPGGVEITPGKAVGFLFIPFFQLYWIFVAINGLPKDWNRIVASFEDLKGAPRLKEGTFLAFSIGMLFAPLGIIMIFPMMSQLCTGINFFAARGNTRGAITYRAPGAR
jgi:hypothetical protein